MTKVFFDAGISLDGFMAGENRGITNPMGGVAMLIHEWMFKQKAFLQHIKMEGGDENNQDNDIIESLFNRIGANIMGKRMFEEGEAVWPEEAPFGCPVFVLTHTPREPWKRPGGTTFYFTNESIDKVLIKAREAAGNKDVRISGGANTIQQFLNAGMIDEFSLHVAPIVLGKGLRLFDNIDKDKVKFKIANVVNSPTVTHLNYKMI